MADPLAEHILDVFGRAVADMLASGEDLREVKGTGGDHIDGLVYRRRSPQQQQHGHVGDVQAGHP